MRAVIFDMDGTLTKPYLDFNAIRAEMGLAREPILEAMERMSPQERAHADAVLIRHEAEAAEHSELNDGATETVRRLEQAGILTALLTRNSRASVATTLAKHALTFDSIYAREDGPLKPSPVPVTTLCERLGVPPSDTLMVGDYLFDIQAGKAAGAHTALVIHDGSLPEYADQAEHILRQLQEVLPICGVD
jgi:HAD superfamily hydrolase (TIGR01509 family)